MNSLEFIDKEIDTYNQLKERAILRIADEDDEIELYKLQRHIDTLNRRIPILQQIKSELEALEIIRNKKVDTTALLKAKSVFAYNLYISEGKEKLKEIEFNIVKKALEVEDE